MSLRLIFNAASFTQMEIFCFFIQFILFCFRSVFFPFHLFIYSFDEEFIWSWYSDWSEITIKPFSCHYRWEVFGYLHLGPHLDFIFSYLFYLNIFLLFFFQLSTFHFFFRVLISSIVSFVIKRFSSKLYTNQFLYYLIFSPLRMIVFLVHFE